MAKYTKENYFKKSLKTLCQKKKKTAKLTLKDPIEKYHIEAGWKVAL